MSLLVSLPLGIMFGLVNLGDRAGSGWAVRPDPLHLLCIDSFVRGRLRGRGDRGLGVGRRHRRRAPRWARRWPAWSRSSGSENGPSWPEPGSGHAPLGTGAHRAHPHAVHLRDGCARGLSSNRRVGAELPLRPDRRCRRSSRMGPMLRRAACPRRHRRRPAHRPRRCRRSRPSRPRCRPARPCPTTCRPCCERRCASCHAYGKDDPAGWGSVLDVSRLIAADIVVPGDPDASRMINRVSVARRHAPHRGPAHRRGGGEAPRARSRTCRPRRQPLSDGDVLDAISSDQIRPAQQGRSTTATSA